MKRRVIYGPPGTGKTTYLIKLIEEEMTHTHPSKLAFVSFTKKGTYEGASRAKKQFKLKKEDLRYFKTIHAICFSELGTSRMDMIDKKHYKLLSDTIGINFTGYYTSDYKSSNDEYLHLVSMEKHNTLLAKKLLSQLNNKRYLYIRYQYEAMKQQLGIIDFDDLLEKYLEKGKPIDVKAAFIDEAQDLTPLQWRVVFKMFSSAEEIYVAGDDDQAVYEWSGADVRTFLSFSSNEVVLNKSYRLPKKILQMAKCVSADINNRKKKRFVSNGSTGEISVEADIGKAKLKGGELVLARTNHLLKALTVNAIEEGLVFQIKGQSSIDRRIVKAIEAYKEYVLGEMSKEDMDKYRWYFEHIHTEIPWQNSLRQPKHVVAYYEKMLQYGPVNKSPVQFETFHSSKGSENDHVVICSDLTKRVKSDFELNRDSELRCLYVGITRAKQKLTIINPMGQDAYPSKYFK